jgi:predicted GH43/DUF377 family glycosyl hydrolase
MIGMPFILFLILIGFPSCVAAQTDSLIAANRQLFLAEYPEAYNPSLVAFKEGFLLTFRYRTHTFISFIGIVPLNRSFEPIGPAQILNTRDPTNKIPSQSEDARIFSYKDELYLVFNDNADARFGVETNRRDMYLAKLSYAGGEFRLENPSKLVFGKENHITIQKNWSPFIWQDKLLFSYRLAPHIVLETDLAQGSCHSFSGTTTPNYWKWGQLRGGTPAQFVDGQYLAFFHSSSTIYSTSSKQSPALHYLMGAYTFSATPPFEITQISSCPIQADDFYQSNRIIYPGGYVVDGPYIHVAYGKRDNEIWIVTLDKAQLKASLINLKTP